MSQFQYEVNFDRAVNAGQLLDKVRLTVEDISGTLSALSREMQPGLEGDAVRLRRWADVLGLSSEDIRKASVCIIAAADNYLQAEQSVHSRLEDIDFATDYSGLIYGDVGGTSSGGGSGGIYDASGNNPSNNNNYYANNENPNNPANSGSNNSNPGATNQPGGAGSVPGAGGGQNIPGTYPNYPGFGDSTNADSYANNSPPGFNFWNATPAERLEWWNNLPTPLRWLYVPPIIGAIAAATGHSPKAVWNFISNLFNRKSGSDSEDTQNADTENGENASGDGGDGKENGYGYDVAACVGAGTIDRPEEDFYESLASVPARAGGGAGAIALNTVFSDLNDKYNYIPPSAFDKEKTLRIDYGAQHSEAQHAITRDEYSEVSNVGSAGLSGSEASAASMVYKIEQTSSESSGIGLAAPLIGAGAIASSAALGMSVTNKLDTDAITGFEAQEPPTVIAKESAGFFAGDLRGEYILLGSAAILAFLGTSVAASARRNNNKKPSDKFRTGYGISAILAPDYISTERTTH